MSLASCCGRALRLVGVSVLISGGILRGTVQAPGRVFFLLGCHWIGGGLWIYAALCGPAWGGGRGSRHVGPALFILTTNVNDHCNNLGRLSKLNPGNRAVVSCSVFSTVHNKFNGVMFIVHGSFRRSFHSGILDGCRNRVPARLIFRTVASLPRNFAYPRRHIGP